MSLMRLQDVWDPFRELEEIGNRFNRLFGTSKRSGDGEREILAKTEWVPACEISENETEYRIRLELPDVKKEDVHVTLENNVLTIRGERKAEIEEKDQKYHRRELSYGSFMRQFAMPSDIDEEKVDASFKDGMLTVRVGRATAKQATSKEIAIQ